jgi:hypothetical protein
MEKLIRYIINIIMKMKREPIIITLVKSRIKIIMNLMLQMVYPILI